jgi:aldose 1-epimerase
MTATTVEPAHAPPAPAPALAVEPPSGWQFVLERAGQRAVVTEVGASLRSWRIGNHELLDGFPVSAAGDDFRGKVLLPWPNRIRGARYAFGGEEHRLAVTDPERGAALHGLVLWASFRPVRRSAEELTLAHRLHPQPGYPFTLDLEVTYALTPNAIAITIAATNLGDGPAPFGAGFHPYLTLGDATIDGVGLELPGRPLAGTDHDFRAARPIGGLALDATFGDLARDAAGRARARPLSPARGRELRVWMDERFRCLQAYTADDVADPRRRRAGVAIEPMTCAPDAFNTGEGLLTLAPGETFRATLGLEADGF